MASLRARMLNVMIRLLVKRRLNGVKDLAGARAVLDNNKRPIPLGIACRNAMLGGVAGEWVIRKRGLAAPPVLLYLHGGGYIACSPRSHRPITTSFAKTGFAVFAPDYRLAPEHPFPAAVDDAEAVWDALVAAGHDPGRIAVAGDSAGGGLALALMIRLRDKGKPLPAAAVLFSPWTDLAGTGESFTTNAGRDPMFTPSGIHDAAGLYLNGADPRTPEASPCYAKLAGLPPLLIEVGERELLRDDSTRISARAEAENVPVTLTVWPVVPHVWQIVGGLLPEARQSLRHAADFLRQHLGAAGRDTPPSGMTSRR